jgi:hypothetical protein
MAFHDAQTPEHLPPSHQGDPWPEADDRDVCDEPSDETDEGAADENHQSD